jgi:hypothetical protein
MVMRTSNSVLIILAISYSSALWCFGLLGCSALGVRDDSCRVRGCLFACGRATECVTLNSSKQQAASSKAIMRCSLGRATVYNNFIALSVTLVFQSFLGAAQGTTS